MADAQCWNSDVIMPLDQPFQPAGSGTAVLRGNLAPGGAVLKQSAASPQLLKHRGRALVFDSPEAYHAVAAEPDIEVDEDSVLVIRYCGPKGYPGMPEIANVPLPAKLLKRGVRDMVRICDGRMSGTAYGTVVLHVAPEAAAGGPLALVGTGDWITLDVPARALTLEVTEDELRPAAPRGPRRRVRQPRLDLAVHRSRAAGRHGRRPRLPHRRQRSPGRPRLPLNARGPTRPGLRPPSPQPAPGLRPPSLARAPGPRPPALPAPGLRPPALNRAPASGRPQPAPAPRPHRCRIFHDNRAPAGARQERSWIVVHVIAPTTIQDLHAPGRPA